MANNFDEFDDTPPSLDDGMMADNVQAEEQPQGSRISETLKTNPAFKIFLILIGVGALVSAGLGVFSSSESQKEEVTSVVGQPGELTSTPGGQASPAFQQAVVEASKQRAEGAVQSGGSALPTPLGGQTQITTLEPSEGGNREDPLSEFRAEAVEPPPPVAAEAIAPPTITDPAVRNIPNYAPPAATYDTQGLTQAMQQQMQTLIGAWQPGTTKVMNITAPEAPEAAAASGQQTQADQQPAGKGKMLVQAGTINYGQMLMEANSDVPGPIMAQIASGPFSGGKAIGTFQMAEDDYLVIRFSLISFKGKDYPVDILALNPDTTLGAMATEVDQRYWSRVVYPAAADFLTGFANSFAQADQSVVVQEGVIVSSRAGSSVRRGFGEGFAKSGERLGDILEQQGNQTRALVKVHAGTPIGLFFVGSVYEDQPAGGGIGGGYGNGYAGGYGSGYGVPGAGGYGNGGYVNPYGLQGIGAQQGGGVPITQFGGQYGVNTQNYGAPGYNTGLNTLGTGYNNSGLNQIPSGSGIQVIQNGNNRQPLYLGQ